MKCVIIVFFVLFKALDSVSAQDCENKSAPNKIHFECCLDNGWSEDVDDLFKIKYRAPYPSNERIYLGKFPKPLNGMSLMEWFAEETNFLISDNERGTIIKSEKLESIGDSALYIKQKVETLKKNGKVIPKETMIRSCILAAYKGNRYYFRAYYAAEEDKAYDQFVKEFIGRMKFVD